MSIGEIISLALSLFAIILTLFMYVKHDKRLKIQEEKLNSYQLKRIEIEDIENKKALIRGNIVKVNDSSRILKVFNLGKSAARNIRIEYISDMRELFSNDQHFPYELLNPQDSTEIKLTLFGGTINTLKIKLIWNDDFKDNNEFEQVLTL